MSSHQTTGQNRPANSVSTVRSPSHSVFNQRSCNVQGANQWAVSQAWVCLDAFKESFGINLLLSQLHAAGRRHPDYATSTISLTRNSAPTANWWVPIEDSRHVRGVGTMPVMNARPSTARRLQPAISEGFGTAVNFPVDKRFPFLRNEDVVATPTDLLTTGQVAAEARHCQSRAKALIGFF